MAKAAGSDERTWQGWGVVCDFDGTITMRDTAWSLLHVFAAQGWQYWSDLYRARRITDHESIIQQFALISTPIPDLVAWALDNSRIRPGAHEFFARCAELGIPVTVASNGLDFYIEPILEHFELPALEVICGRGEQRSGGIAVSYEHLWDAGYPELRDQKLLAVQRLRARGLKVIYIGDGDPDYRAAAASDLVFARYLLLDRCRAEGTRCVPFEDFFDLVLALELGPEHTAGVVVGETPPAG